MLIFDGNKWVDAEDPTVKYLVDQLNLLGFAIDGNNLVEDQSINNGESSEIKAENNSSVNPNLQLNPDGIVEPPYMSDGLLFFQDNSDKLIVDSSDFPRSFTHIDEQNQNVNLNNDQNSQMSVWNNDWKCHLDTNHLNQNDNLDNDQNWKSMEIEKTDNSLDQNQLNLIEEAINLSISHLDYLGGEIDKIKSLQNLRTEVQTIKSHAPEKNESKSSNIFPFAITGEESLREMSFKILLLEKGDLVSLHQIETAIAWINTPVSFAGIDNLSDDETPALTLTKHDTNSSLLSYFSLIDMYHIWSLCRIVKLEDYDCLSGFSDNIEENLSEVSEDIESLKEVIKYLHDHNSPDSEGD